MYRLLKNRVWMLFWVGNIWQELGIALFRVVGMAAVYEVSGSVMQTAGVMVASTLPPFLFGSFSGAIVDRYPRKWVMVTMDIVRGGAIWLLLLFVDSSGNLSVWGTYLIMVLMGAATTFYTPARQAMIPSLVEDEEIVSANSFNMAVLPLSWAIGFSVGGYLFTQFGLLVMVTLTAACYVTAALFTLFVKPQRTVSSNESEEDVPITQAIKDGFVYMRKHEMARVLTTMEFLEHIPHGIWTDVLLLVFATDVLANGLENGLESGSVVWGQINGIFFAAMCVGVLLSMSMVKTIARMPGWMVIGNAFLNFALTFIFALSTDSNFAILLALLFGIPFALRDVAQDSLLQTTVDHDVMGRVYAFREMGRSVLFMISGLFFSWMVGSGTMSIRAVYVTAALLYLLTALYALSSKALRESKIKSKKAVGQANLSTSCDLPATI